MLVRWIMGTKVTPVLEPELCATRYHSSSFLGIAETAALSKSPLRVTISTVALFSPPLRNKGWASVKDEGMRFRQAHKSLITRKFLSPVSISESH